MTALEGQTFVENVNQFEAIVLSVRIFTSFTTVTVIVKMSSNVLLFPGRVFDVVWHHQISWSSNKEITQGGRIPPPRLY